MKPFINTINFKLLGSCIILCIILVSCEDRKWDNPADPDSNLAPNEWAPNNLAVQPLSDSNIKITWQQKVKTIDGFVLERKSGNGNYEILGSINSNVYTYTDTALHFSSDYTYRVKAFAKKNNSGYAVSNKIQTIFPGPSAIRVNVINDSETRITWNDNCDFEKGYRIERKSNSEDYILIAELGANTNSFNDTGLIFGIGYNYRVCAFTEYNYSYYLTSSVNNTSFPPPTNLIATPISDTDISLTWLDNCSYENGYQIERSIDGSNFTQIVERGENTTTYTDTSLILGSNYIYRVYAFTTINQSGYATSNTTSPIFPPPTNLTATAQNDTDILLEWIDNCGFEEGFRIERQEDGGNFTQIAELSSDTYQFTDNGLAYGPVYTYQIYAYTSTNQSLYTVSNTTSTIFPAPTNLTATALDDEQILLEWVDNCSFEEGFRLIRYADGGIGVQIAEIAADIAQFTDSGLSFGSNYTYRIYAYTVTNQSAHATSNTTKTIFPAPTNLTATALNDEQILLEWVDNCGFEEGYGIERQEEGGSWTQVVELAANVTQFTDTNLSYGQNYAYRAYAYTNTNQSLYTVSNTTSTIFPAPTILTSTAQNDVEILLEWVDNCEFESGFRIERQEDGDSWVQIAEVATDITQYTDTDINTANNFYNYRVYAYTANNVSDYSNSVGAGFVTDIDGNVYQCVKIGDQLWIAENLKVTHYRNGNVIPNVTDGTEWSNLTTGAYCYYNNDANNAATYGGLYNWYAVNDNRNIAPQGWHVPSDAEWQTLIDYLGGSTIAGGALKDTGSVHWDWPNSGATNSSGFTALPGSYRQSGGDWGDWNYLGSTAKFWSSTEYLSNFAWCRILYNNTLGVGHNNNIKPNGFSIRCIRD